MNLSKAKTSILLVTHYMTRTEGSEEADQRILTFLQGKVRKIIYIALPFPNSVFREAIFEIFENGKLVREERMLTFKGPQTLHYLANVFLILWLFIKARSNFDLCIALENLSFTTLFPFRFLGLIKRSIYYSVDFVPQRFPNFLLNNLYHILDRFACTHSDMNWVVTKEQIQARKTRDRNKIKYSPFTLTPIGYKRSIINIKSIDEIDFYHIIFAGALLENSGPQLGIKALPLLLKKFPKIHYTIIGKGIFEKELRRQVSQQKLNNFIKFAGYIESFTALTKILASASIGLAPYVPKPNSLSYYSDPAKIKLYLVCGLPIITTNVTTLAPVIERTNSGKVIEYDEKNLSKTIEYMLSNKRKYELYKKAAVKLSEKFDIDNILNQAIKKIPN